jgi:hypothetical protein
MHKHIFTHTLIKKYTSDTEIALTSGTFYSCDSDSEEWFSLPKSYDKYIIYKPGGKELIAVLDKKAISENLCQLAVNKYLKAGQQISTNRGIAAGSKHRTTKTTISGRRYEKGLSSNSNILGYIDSANHKRPCRLTSFCREYYEEYTAGIPFIQAIDTCFKNTLPDIYTKQFEICSQKKNFQISDTAFSTVTVNYNFQTALHKDSGDYREGFGNLVVCQKGTQGGEILFPQYKLRISIETGDFLAMDVHEWHCNNTIKYIDVNAYRLSFVCYYRERIHQCNEINNNILALTGDLSGKSWDTGVVFKKIFEAIGISDLPPKISIQSDTPWWAMSAGRFKLLYKFKRYILYDIETNEKIHNLIPAYNYALQIKNNTDITVV